MVEKPNRVSEFGAGPALYNPDGVFTEFDENRSERPPENQSPAYQAPVHVWQDKPGEE